MKTLADIIVDYGYVIFYVSFYFVDFRLAKV